MSVSVKALDIIRQFDGEGDFSEWIKKVELVATLQKIEALEKFVPLFLSGGAFSVYDALEKEVKDSYDKLKGALTRAFSTPQVKAYEEFTSRTLRQGESVDVYLSDLRRLAGLVAREVSDEWVKCAMISGLPSETRRQLTAACAVEKMLLSEVVERARTLMAVDGSSHSSVSAISSWNSQQRSKKPGIVKVPLICFSCQKEGHIAKYCEEKRGRVKCFACGELGHVATSCPLREAKKE
jgi:hypothetical protein